jgi:hypothetical protein
MLGDEAEKRGGREEFGEVLTVVFWGFFVV